MTTSLLALLDDIVTVLDDVAVMTKSAAQRTAGVLGDDLALNAEQVSGVRAERELPVVWAVAKGSARNKLILVPAALLLAAFAEFLVTPLLMLGGCYLCYEGFDKVAGRFLHPDDKAQEKENVRQALHDPDTDLVKFEQQKIKGAIRTDFVLSAEIIVISMGTVQGAALLTQMGTVIAIAILMTVGVYGLVAAIVKFDDAGIYLASKPSAILARIGRGILVFAPWFMKGLVIVGTIAMFLVGGNILAHGIPGVESWFHQITAPLEKIATMGALLTNITRLLLNALLGLVTGACLAPVVHGTNLLLDRFRG